MKPRLKKIDQQVIVITGASSGIGLATAQAAAEAGAKLMLISRSGEALGKIAHNLADGGADIRWSVADVADEAALRTAATAAIDQFGRIDTWINNAGVSIFGTNEEVSREDQRRLFDTNFWGVVNGSLIAVEYMRKQGGALINIGSELSDLAVPLQGIYSASKHAVKGFTDSLRMELEREGTPISVTLIKPAAIDTLFVKHAKNYMDVQPRLPAPLYAPQLVAKSILSAAQRPQRDVFVGGAAKLTSLTARHAPRLFDFIASRLMYDQQRTQLPERHPEQHSLDSAGDDLRVRGYQRGLVLENSLYTTAALHRKTGYALLGGALFVGIGAYKYMQSHRAERLPHRLRQLTERFQ
jgi:short-subunit dehydrogenase